MKALITVSALLSILSLIGGLFGTTPNGEPATHQLFVSIFTGLFTVGCVIEQKRLKKLRE